MQLATRGAVVAAFHVVLLRHYVVHVAWTRSALPEAWSRHGPHHVLLDPRGSGTPQLLRQAAREGEGEAASPAACSAGMDSDIRVLLYLDVLPHHGSTSLETLLMSSTDTTSLCVAGTWQCEARFITCKDFKEDGQHFPPRGESPNRMAMNMNCGLNSGNMLEFGTKFATYQHGLAKLSRYWDLTRRVLLLKHGNRITRYPRTGPPYLSGSDMPEPMVAHGVTRLLLAHVFMWNPRCLTGLSKAPINETMEMFILSGLYEHMLQLEKYKFPLLVLLRGDVLWRWRCTERCIGSFLPCAGQLNSYYLPQWGLDIFKGNNFKTRLTVADYSLRTKPEASGYDVETGACSQGDFEGPHRARAEEIYRGFMLRSCRCGRIPNFRSIYEAT